MAPRPAWKCAILTVYAEKGLPHRARSLLHLVAMDTHELITALTAPDCYPHPAERVDVIQTHSAAVFLAGQRVYKIKKPVDFGFLDYSTLERRRHFCAEEVRLNRRLAPDVYRGVVPIVRTPAGLRVDGDGEALEWAVEMTRLAEEDTLLSRLRRGQVTPAILEALAERLAAFHAAAAREPHPGAYAGFAAVAYNARENFEQTQAHIGKTVSAAVWSRARALTEQALREQQARITRRAQEHRACETHGDLRLEHVYLHGQELIVIDGVEFNERFRYADPIADIAFLIMDLRHRHRYDLAAGMATAYTRAAEDRDGGALFPLYSAYRAAVRAKVAGFAAAEPALDPAQRERAQQAARAYWTLALDTLSAPEHRPALLLVGGLPGTGKSTLADGLAKAGHGRWIRSDAVRKSLAGLHPTDAGTHAGIYTPEWTRRVYDACLHQARDALIEGQRCIVDASFSDDHLRERFINLAQRNGARVVFLECTAPPEVIRDRLHHRKGDVSDADWSIYLRKKARWQAPSTETVPYHHLLSTQGPPEAVLARAETALAAQDLAQPR